MTTTELRYHTSIVPIVLPMSRLCRGYVEAVLTFLTLDSVCQAATQTSDYLGQPHNPKPRIYHIQQFCPRALSPAVCLSVQLLYEITLDKSRSPSHKGHTHNIVGFCLSGESYLTQSNIGGWQSLFICRAQTNIEFCLPIFSTFLFKSYAFLGNASYITSRFYST